MADVQLTQLDVAAGHSDYVVPASALVRLKSVRGEFQDNGAGADWIPAVQLISDSGHVIATSSDQGSKVTAGGDADASFFPGVKPAAATTQLHAPTQQSYTVTGQVIPSGVVTAITFDAGAIYTATSTPLSGSGFPFGNFGALWDCVITLEVQWPAGAYDRYIEIVDPSFDTSGAAVRWRVRGGATPDQDIQTVTTNFVGNPFGARPVEFNAFQASGVNQTIQRRLSAAQKPRIPGQFYV